MTTGRGRSPVVCGVDIGSTNTKVIALDPRGVVVARRRRATPRAAAGAAVDALALLAAIEEMILAAKAIDWDPSPSAALGMMSTPKRRTVSEVV